MTSDAAKLATLKGRAATFHPDNRFESLQYVPDEPSRLAYGNDDGAVPTRYLVDTSQTALVKNTSPDIPFSYGLNPYRGCEHGCAYCYARQTHEYLGLSSGLDFETVILTKPKIATLLGAELRRPKWQPQVVNMSGVTDCYQPLERKLQLTRGCLQVFAAFRNPVAIITKNHLVTRDLDVLQELSEFSCVSVGISLTTLNEDLRSKLEPRTSTATRRLDAVRKLREARVQVGVMIAPIIPGLNDHEIASLLEAAADAGAQFAGMGVVQLPYSVKDVFVNWLNIHYPERAERVLNRIREVHGGQLNDPRFHTRTKGEGRYAEQLWQLFRVARRRVGLDQKLTSLTTEHFAVPDAQGRHARQPSLFASQ
jgi:DNA repair photolyase